MFNSAVDGHYLLFYFPAEPHIKQAIAVDMPKLVLCVTKLQAAVFVDTRTGIIPAGDLAFYAIDIAGYLRVGKNSRYTQPGIKHQRGAGYCF